MESLWSKPYKIRAFIKLQPSLIVTGFFIAQKLQLQHLTNLCIDNTEAPAVLLHPPFEVLAVMVHCIMYCGIYPWGREGKYSITEGRITHISVVYSLNVNIS